MAQFTYAKYGLGSTTRIPFISSSWLTIFEAGCTPHKHLLETSRDKKDWMSDRIQDLLEQDNELLENPIAVLLGNSMIQKLSTADHAGIKEKCRWFKFGDDTPGKIY